MKLKVFLSRYHFLLFIILFGAGFMWYWFSGNIYPWLFCASIGFIIRMSVGPLTEYKKVCKKCGHESNKGEKYCTECGSIMKLKKIIRYKICRNGHKIEDEHDVYKFCPKCGEILKEEKFGILRTEKN